MLPAVGWGTIGKQEDPRSVVGDAVLTVDILAGSNHFKPLLNRSAHWRIATGCKPRGLELIGCLEIGLELHWPEGQDRQLHSFESHAVSHELVFERHDA